ncbi:conserved hypothetical protein [Histoplasma capsulatum var. duboisii H88]|uniref:Uncharacterized protein n=2 Tax=Ajellomyces capsulatus TaxID=5037 RepID=F0UIX2_AJEC8|nr:conserved hypothetical protein [Histoplasma capsulatum H143]EGC46469.1 conserved hypothetical protein [Histoplasma capsulatum var. duboisii H88]
MARTYKNKVGKHFSSPRCHSPPCDTRTSKSSWPRPAHNLMDSAQFESNPGFDCTRICTGPRLVDMQCSLSSRGTMSRFESTPDPLKVPSWAVLQARISFHMLKRSPLAMILPANIIAVLSSLCDYLEELGAGNTRLEVDPPKCALKLYVCMYKFSVPEKRGQRPRSRSLPEGMGTCYAGEISMYMEGEKQDPDGNS